MCDYVCVCVLRAPDSALFNRPFAIADCPQASIAIGVLFIAYILQQRHNPFLVTDSPAVRMSMFKSLAHLSLPSAGAPRRSAASESSCVRRAVDRMVYGGRRMAILAYVSVDYNIMEASFLFAAVCVLTAGMVFVSHGFAPTSVGFAVMTWLVAALVLAATAAFLAFVAFEVYRSVRHANLHALTRQAEADAMERSLKQARRTRKDSARLDRPKVGSAARAARQLGVTFRALSWKSATGATSGSAGTHVVFLTLADSCRSCFGAERLAVCLFVCLLA